MTEITYNAAHQQATEAFIKNAKTGEKSMSHTPAPWSVNEWPQPDREISIGAVGTPLIAKVMMRDVSVNEHKANANLIAAAPELLEVLENLTAWSKKYPSSRLYDALTDAHRVTEINQIVNKAEAAIKKARGEA